MNYNNRSRNYNNCSRYRSHRAYYLDFIEHKTVYVIEKQTDKISEYIDIFYKILNITLFERKVLRLIVVIDKGFINEFNVIDLTKSLIERFNRLKKFDNFQNLTDPKDIKWIDGYYGFNEYTGFIRLFVRLYNFSKYNNIGAVVYTELNFLNCDMQFKLIDMRKNRVTNNVYCFDPYHKINNENAIKMIAGLRENYDIDSIFSGSIGREENRKILFTTRSIMLYAVLIDLQSNKKLKESGDNELFELVQAYLLDVKNRVNLKSTTALYSSEKLNALDYLKPCQEDIIDAIAMFQNKTQLIINFEEKMNIVNNHFQKQIGSIDYYTLKNT